MLMVAPMLDLYSQRGERLEDRRALVSLLNAKAEKLPASDVLDAQVADLRKLESASQTTLKGVSDSDLRIHIDDLAASAGATISSMGELGAQNEGSDPAIAALGYRRIGLSIAVNGAYGAVVNLLAAIEKGTPPLVLSNLQIGTGSQPSGPPSGARVDATFEVYGFRSAAASPPLKQ
jgi:hypothetical protein